MDITHLSLLERVRASTADQRWQEFVAIYSPYIEGYLRRLGVQEVDSDDIRQEVLQVVVRVGAPEPQGPVPAARSVSRSVSPTALPGRAER